MSHKVKAKEQILDSIQVGSIIAFTVKSYSSVIMLSGKVQELTYDEDGLTYITQTHNGSLFYVKRSSVVWLKMGSRWPQGIYNALKFGKISSGAK